MENLILTAEKIRQEYEGFKSYLISSENIAFTDTGMLNTSRNDFPLTLEGLDQFAQIADIPKPFFRTLESDLRAVIFNRRFQRNLCDRKIPHNLRINLNSDAQVVGFDDPKLLRISPLKLIDAVSSSLPDKLSPEQIEVAKIDITPVMLQISCFSPQNITEPRPGDTINGGIDIVHHISGDGGTQVSCYLRRLVCSNGATTHICDDNKHLRVRRLNNGSFDESDMLSQIKERLGEAWSQIDDKLDAIKALTERKRSSLEFLEQARTRFSVSNRMLNAIKRATAQDEIGPTNTQYDLFNAISRVATHDNMLTFRQQRTLSRLAGEFSQQDVHQCNSCGSWLTTLN